MNLALFLVGNSLCIMCRQHSITLYSLMVESKTFNQTIIQDEIAVTLIYLK